MKLFISKLTTTMLALSLAFSCSSVLAADKKTETAKLKPTVQQPKKIPSFMFVIDAKKGVIKKDKNGQYHLILKKVDMNQVIMFSDRPQRIVKYITGKDLQTLWKEGKKSFEKDPPNAVLSGMGIKTKIVILNGIQVDKIHIRMPISISKDVPGNDAPAVLEAAVVTSISLTIDASWSSFWGMFLG